MVAMLLLLSDAYMQYFYLFATMLVRNCHQIQDEKKG